MILKKATKVKNVAIFFRNFSILDTIFEAILLTKEGRREGNFIPFD